jgi:hypothetical protein
MKKLTIILVVMLSMALMLTGVAFAQSITTTSGTVGSTSTTTFTVSNNVTITYTAGTNGITYSAGANHNKGSKTYASTSSNSSIYYIGNTSTPSFTAPTSGTDSAVPTGFTTKL